MENVGEHADLLVLYAVSCGVSSSSVTYTRAQVRMNSTVSVCALLKRQRQTQQGRGGEREQITEEAEESGDVAYKPFHFI